jgi:hypothetical protein
MKSKMMMSFFTAALLLSATTSFAAESVACKVQEQLTSYLDADYPYEYVKTQEISLDETASGSASLGTIRGLEFLVSYSAATPRIITKVKGIVFQNQAASNTATTIVTSGLWTVVVSCEKK